SFQKMVRTHCISPETLIAGVCHDENSGKQQDGPLPCPRSDDIGSGAEDLCRISSASFRLSVFNWLL
ncbi:MAG: hypothetical protein AAEJ59_08970, partial [Arenicellales bacterium]